MYVCTSFLMSCLHIAEASVMVIFSVLCKKICEVHGECIARLYFIEMNPGAWLGMCK